MRVYLACPFEAGVGSLCEDVYVLESFYYLKPEHIPFIPKCKDVLIDSGAFTFISSQSKGKEVNFDDYVERYTSFLKQNKIKHYFELDVDKVKGLGYVEEVRRYLEKSTGTPSIPVWHKSRGIEYYKKMCKDYSYIAIGGLAIKDIKGNEYPKLAKLVNYAHANRCKVHGLGFTQMSWLTKIHWDSVDSSSWTYGHRYRTLAKFDPKKKKMVYFKPEDKRIIDSYGVDKFCFKEWIKYQRWAESNL